MVKLFHCKADSPLSCRWPAISSCGRRPSGQWRTCRGLLAMKRKPAKPQMMATYYAKLTKIFSVSGSRLYNGYAW